MKKLMIAAAIVCAAAFAQASAFNWNVQETYDGYQIDKTYGGNYSAWENNADYAKGFTVYLIDAALCAQSDFLADWQKGTSLSALADSYGVDVTSGKISGNLNNSGKLAAAQAIESTKVDFNAFAVFEADDGNYLFISEVTAFNHNDQVTPNVNVKTSNASMVFNGTEWSSAGYYTAIPEPTSGLLLLLGVAGLALRRRRA